jgi:hypothetical protein
LVFEHVRPVSLVIRRLLEPVPANEAALRSVLAELSEHVIITKEEDDKWTVAGYRNVMPDRRWVNESRVASRPVKTNADALCRQTWQVGGTEAR